MFLETMTYSNGHIPTLGYISFSLYVYCIGLPGLSQQHTRQQKFIFPQFCGWKSNTEVSASPEAFLLGFRWPPSGRVLTCSFLCVQTSLASLLSVQIASSYKDTIHIGLGPTLKAPF